MTDLASRLPFDPAKAARTADPTLFAALFFVSLATLLCAVANSLLLDPDTWWHVAIGRQIVETRSFPWTDTFSHTFYGQPWIAKEWLSQVLLFGAYALDGWPGVTLLADAAIAATFALLFGWLLRRVRWSVALAFTVLAAAFAAPHFLARPHVFSWPLLVLWMAGLLSAAEARRAPSWWLVPLIVLWSNLHASVLLAFVIAFPLGLEATASAEPGRRLNVLLHWAVFGTTALLAAMISPYGANPLLIALQLFRSGEAFSYLTEWQPLGLDAIGALAAAMLVVALVSLGLQPRRNAFRIILVLLLAYMAARHSRFVNSFAIVSVMVIASPLARYLPAQALDGESPRTAKAHGRPARRLWHCRLAKPGVVLSTTPRRADNAGSRSRSCAHARRYGQRLQLLQFRWLSDL